MSRCSVANPIQWAKAEKSAAVTAAITCMIRITRTDAVQSSCSPPREAFVELAETLDLRTFLAAGVAP